MAKIQSIALSNGTYEIDAVHEAQVQSKGNNSTPVYFDSSCNAQTITSLSTSTVTATTQFNIGSSSRYLKYNSSTGCVELVC